ncbi:arf-GAP with Rho-GAP domain, ANK repeat and PH domain-containing protein 1-like isoform X4 [Pomacea canaliculata]|uniref:arf-GAP with Rho-GAP domain, ANK repeat and PH domain-containing protein 1-like isoform X4 n=1 Tax=Pomacea canaliculata TaxID=400727 RepID=UPI000D73025D|nr:arf-GAP with Rho-GAP domain, ANK repeat and PH domain-containing protein 1-like isoform X4 [Pomacea canaliculata]
MMADSARHSSVDEDDVYDIPPSRQSFAFPDERKLEIPPSLPPKKHPNRSSIQDALGLSRAAQEPRPTPKPRGAASPKGTIAAVEMRSPTSLDGILQADTSERPKPRPRPRTRSSKCINKLDNFPPNADEIEAMINEQVKQEMETFESEYSSPNPRHSGGTGEALVTNSTSSLSTTVEGRSYETENIYCNQDAYVSPTEPESEDESMYVNTSLLTISETSQPSVHASSTVNSSAFDGDFGNTFRFSKIVEEEYATPSNIEAMTETSVECSLPQSTKSSIEPVHEANFEAAFGSLELSKDGYARVNKQDRSYQDGYEREFDPFVVSKPHTNDLELSFLQPTKVWETSKESKLNISKPQVSEMGQSSKIVEEESLSEEEYEAVWVSSKCQSKHQGLIRPKSDFMVFSPKQQDVPVVQPHCGQQLGEYVELDPTYNIPPPARTPPPLPEAGVVLNKPPSVPPRPQPKNSAPISHVTFNDTSHVLESSTDNKEEPSSAVFKNLETPGISFFPDDPFKYSRFLKECQEFNAPSTVETPQGRNTGAWPGDQGGCQGPSDFTASFPDIVTDNKVTMEGVKESDTYCEIPATAGLNAKSDLNFRLSSIPPPPPRTRPIPLPAPRVESPPSQSGIYSVALDLETEARENIPSDDSSDSSEDQFTSPYTDFNQGDRYSAAQTSVVAIIPAFSQRKQERYGYLHKQGGVRANKGWKLRWVVFNGKDLRYYDSNKSLISKKIIPLSSMESVKSDIQRGDTTRFKFHLVTSLRSRIFVFAADTKDDCCQWANTLMAAIIANKSCRQEEKRKPDKEGFVKFENNNKKYYVAITGDMFCYYDSFQDFELNSPVHEIEMKLSSVKEKKKNKLQLSTHYSYFMLAFESPQDAQSWRMAIEDAIAEGLADDSVLEKVYENESNQICADCNDDHPHWASINLGIVLCKKCAGIHRMFDSSLSKIRSLRMDTRVWTPSLIELMKAVGNSHANQLLEHKLQPGQKPTKDSLPEERRKFAVSKYQHRSFCNKHPLSSDKRRLNEALLQVASTSNLMEAVQIIFSGADITYTRGGERENAYNIAKQHGQRLLMEFLYQNGGDRLPGEEEAANEEGRLREDVRLQGFLLKTGPVGRTFDTRWCVLEHGALTYYLNDKSTTAKDSIDRKNILCLQEVVSDRTESVFEISTTKGNNRIYLFAAENPSERGIWMRAISKLIAPVAIMEHVGMMDFSLASLVFMRESVSEDWQPTWVMLSWRLLYFLNKDLKLDNVDLRKASHIKMQDPQSGSCPLCPEKAGCLVLGNPGKTLYIQAHLSRDTNRIFDAVSAAIKLSGMSLLEQQLTPDNIPVIVDKCLNQIYGRGQYEEGVYRKSATQSRVIQLLDDLRKDARGVRLDDSDIHEIASCLKRFLRELEDSLFTRQLYNEWIHTSQITDHQNKFLWYRYLLEKLPLVNYSTLKCIVTHIWKMSLMEAANKMSVEALVTCFAPTLMRTEHDVGANNPANEITVLLDIVSQRDYLFQIAQHERDQEATIQAYAQRIIEAQQVSRNSQPSGQLLMAISMYTYNGECEMVNTTPGTSAKDVVDYIIRKRNLANSFVLNEILFKGALVRPLFPKDNILMTTGRWGDWDESVRTGENVCLCLTNTELLEKLHDHLDTSRALFGELKYADSRSKKKFKKTTTEFKQCMLTFYKDSKAKSPLCSWKIEDLTIYMGVNASREPPTRFGFTFLVNSREDKGKNHHFGHCVCLDTEEEMCRWVAALLLAQNPEGLLAWNR